ncbi:hypothetical protein D9758_008863 [Tetrapyrgos nigripes]|uniref:Uncharacterized protein n=1 Tax=Tetrapyrgos nigripes TaxID=182062 RepID=A0A8H5CLR0_9AGAR|nr:hypothetical protein D9758_008863 [Tetrapyrgos nigripes]
MRRITSVFSSSSSSSSHKDRKAPKRVLSVNDDNAQAQSSSSSSGSASIILKTPEDLPATPVSTKQKKWLPWFSKRSSIAVHDPPPQWQPGPAPLLRPAPPGRLRGESEYADSEDDSGLAFTAMPAVTPESLSKATRFIHVHTANALITQPSSSPFRISQHSPLFPRSCSPSRSLPTPVTLVSSLHKRRLLRRLDNSPSALSPSEAQSIIIFSSKSPPAPMPSPESPLSFDEKAPSQTDIVSPFSPGLRRWISRPTFEDRVCLWSPGADGTITCQRITAIDYALAALEFSEAIEASADGDASPQLPIQSPKQDSNPSPSPIPPSPPASDVSSSPSSSSTNLSIPQSKTTHLSPPLLSAPLLSAPSPLRNEHNPTVTHPSPMRSYTAPSALNVRSPSPDEVAPAEPVSSPKRGVRFADNDREDREDNVPIGYVMRVKKQREEKARFLREEKERRMFEEEHSRVEEERLKRERQRNEWEKEKMAWEKEKRAMEEERKKRLYAEELVAARQRAESSRMGMKLSSSSASLRDPLERNVASTTTPRRYSRPGYDSSPRQASEPNGYQSSPNTSSPESSRPPSIAASSHNRNSSRPPSVHSSNTMSLEDVRNSQIRNSYNGSISSSRHGMDRSSTYSGWSASNTSLKIPPVPQIPPFAMDMPLLPPSAPFMMSQHSRSRSRNSSTSSSRTSSRQRLPSNGSTEHVNQQPRPKQDSSPRNSTFGSSPSSSPRQSSFLSHHRRASDDGGQRMSLSPLDYGRRIPQSPSSPHLPHGSSTMPRGRPMQPVNVYPQLPSPWTAMPTAQGTIPMTMPYAMPVVNHASRQVPSRRSSAPLS